MCTASQASRLYVFRYGLYRRSGSSTIVVAAGNMDKMCGVRSTYITKNQNRTIRRLLKP